MDRRRCIIAALALALVVSGGPSAFAGKTPKIPKETLAEVGPILAKQFQFEPFDPPMPDHLWMDAEEGQVFFLHFDKPVTEKGARLIFIGEGVKGRFCVEDQPDGGKTGYVHFHSLHKPEDAEHGHGGHQGAEGYWLRHIAVGNFEMMGTKFSPGIAQNFMHTDSPRCQ